MIHLLETDRGKGARRMAGYRPTMFKTLTSIPSTSPHSHDRVWAQCLLSQQTYLYKMSSSWSDQDAWSVWKAVVWSLENK